MFSVDRTLFMKLNLNMNKFENPCKQGIGIAKK